MKKVFFLCSLSFFMSCDPFNAKIEEEDIPFTYYEANNADYFSFTADKDGFWNRKLDYMFTNATFEGGIVHLDEARGGMATMPLSDHAPLSGILKF